MTLQGFGSSLFVSSALAELRCATSGFEAVLGYLDWQFKAQELEDPTPPTGDVYAPLLWPLMATLSMGAIAFLLSRRKHREEP